MSSSSSSSSSSNSSNSSSVSAGRAFWSNVSPGAPGIRGLLACLFLWVPLLTVLLDFMLDGFRGRPELGRWLMSAAVGDTVCLICFGGSLLLHRVVDLILKRRGKVEGWRPPGAFFVGLSMLLMPCVLPLGLGVGACVAKMVGRTYHPGFGNYRVGLGFGVIICALFFLYRARTEARARVRDLENANLKAQLAALTAEMNPHMLFNALNTVASLVHDDPDLAEETVLRLADVYRGTLRAARSGAMHSLADEIRLCEAYLRVESARYGDRLKVIILHPSDGLASIQVPMLLLQPLVENAVRHGIEPHARGGTITIGAQKLGDQTIAITVDDDGVGFGNSTRKGNGVAITNCKERLRLAYGPDATLDLGPRSPSGGGTTARVHLPRLKHDVVVAVAVLS